MPLTNRELIFKNKSVTSGKAGGLKFGAAQSRLALRANIALI